MLEKSLNFSVHQYLHYRVDTVSSCEILLCLMYSQEQGKDLLIVVKPSEYQKRCVSAL